MLGNIGQTDILVGLGIHSRGCKNSLKQSGNNSFYIVPIHVKLHPQKIKQRHNKLWEVLEVFCPAQLLSNSRPVSAPPQTAAPVEVPLGLKNVEMTAKTVLQVKILHL